MYLLPFDSPPFTHSIGQVFCGFGHHLNTLVRRWRTRYNPSLAFKMCGVWVGGCVPMLPDQPSPYDRDLAALLMLNSEGSSLSGRLCIEMPNRDGFVILDVTPLVARQTHSSELTLIAGDLASTTNLFSIFTLDSSHLIGHATLRMPGHAPADICFLFHRVTHRGK